MRAAREGRSLQKWKHFRSPTTPQGGVRWRCSIFAFFSLSLLFSPALSFFPFFLSFWIFPFCRVDLSDRPTLFFQQQYNGGSGI